ncbi:MAG: Asp-tRNA(Asn)/Glu-tRNA(Gln) amidotransferase GatCAB subunit B [Deltaproteobacteria bacterium]|nr:MAG: Asp-tRNA(Asn)/Glu-tRNA(Gln) amidotransferase GatCAB subunit B [Deltaproteobacteria bacterium]
MKYDIIICFEIHAELDTESKLFCHCPTKPGAEPNTHVCPVCTGHPGTLPVLNQRAVEFCVKAGLAFNCRINEHARFARKNYFYPDLPKGYQISQYELPLCEDGYFEIEGDDGQPYPVGIKRIHLEEDAGKLVHSTKSFDESTYSLVDYNRAGVPLIEIVADHTRNPIRSITEAKRYLEGIRQTLQYIGASQCVIEEGQFRCDVNVSIRPEGHDGFLERSEIKNMASFRAIMDALNYEIKRQMEVIESGGALVQETRLYDEDKGVTIPMRSKEDAPDYRYFPEPDLVELNITEGFIEKVKAEMPELPQFRAERLIRQYSLTRSEALVLTKQKEVSDFFEQSSRYCQDPKKLAFWITKDLFRVLNENSLDIRACPITPENFGKLVKMVSGGDITEAIARMVLDEMLSSGKPPEAIIEEKDLKPIQQDDTLMDLVSQVISENPGAVNKIKSGQTQPLNFLIGQVMRKTRGKADPHKVKKLLSRELLE